MVLEEKFGDLKAVGTKADFHSSLLLPKPVPTYLMSQNMVNKLGDVLAGCGVLYPVNILGRHQPFYRFECTRVIDCLDYEKSSYKNIRLSFLKRRIGIRKPVFINSKIENEYLFSIPKTSLSMVFATEAFKELVVANRITGVKLKAHDADFDAWES